MNREEQCVFEFMKNAEQEVRDVPNTDDESVRHLRAKLVLEEALEFVHASGFKVAAVESVGATTTQCLPITNWVLVENRETHDEIEMVDALADLLYVVYGASLAFGFSPIAAYFNEVHRSNMSKFVEGKFVKDESGKVKKPDTYSRPDLRAIRDANYLGTVK